MRTIIMNDTVVEAALGERLLDVARRNRVHIGFICNGNGICSTCECKVLQGREALSPPNDAERTWLPPSRLRRGHRLACQSAIITDAPIRVLTRAEELRRQWDAVLDERQGEIDQPLSVFLENIATITVEHLSLFPANVVATVGRVGVVRTILPVRDMDTWLYDAQRLGDKMLGLNRYDPEVVAEEGMPYPPPPPDAEIVIKRAAPVPPTGVDPDEARYVVRRPRTNIARDTARWLRELSNTVDRMYRTTRE